MANTLLTAKQVVEELTDLINKTAAETGVNAVDIALMVGYSMGAPVDVSHLINQEVRG
jgi:hypothetical protein